MIHFMKMLFFLTSYLINELISTQNGIILGDINAHPLWNTSSEIPHTCFLTHNTDNTIVFLGSIARMCSLQILLTENSTAELIIPNINLTPYLFFIEYPESVSKVCSAAYEVITGFGKHCTRLVRNPEFSLHLQGNTSLTIHRISNISITDTPCDVTTSEETLDCEVTLYEKMIQCSNLESINCHIEIPHNCSAILKNMKMLLQCLNDTNSHHNKTILIVYNMNTQHLNVHGDVGLLHETAFNSLQNLESLYLVENNLKKIQIEAFTGMENLQFLALSNNKLTFLAVGIFQDLKSLFYLRLDRNVLETLEPGVFLGLTSLYTLNLGENKLHTLKPGTFDGLQSLSELYLFRNELKSLHNDIFKPLLNLQVLDLFHNKLQAIQSGEFHNLIYLFQIDLGKNDIHELDNNAFQGLDNLVVLYINHNNLKNLSKDSIQMMKKLKHISLASNQLKEFGDYENLQSLNYLDLSENQLNQIPPFSNFSHLKFLNIKGNSLLRMKQGNLMGLRNSTDLYASQQEICECYVSQSSQCNAEDPRSPYLTCDRLLSDRILMGMMWVIGTNALCGNLFVLGWRITQERQFSVQSILLSNLAMSDFLMGVYMVIIAAADIYFGEYFPMQAEAWRTGVTCMVAGAICIIASEASVFFVTLISIDRFINIRFPLSTKKLRERAALITAGCIWIIAITIGAIPSALAGRNVYFYVNSHVCIGLPLAKLEAYTLTKTSKLLCTEYSLYCFYIDISESKPQGLFTGMYFSTAVFLGLNCICYIIILGCYVEIIQAVLKSSKGTGVNKEMTEQIRLTTKVTAIVATDFFCWFPVIILGILVQTGVLILPPSVFAWCVTFVLPINSGINPYLYTISYVISDLKKQRRAGNSETGS